MADFQDAVMEPAIISEGNPGADLRAFRSCLGQFGTGVTVMTTQSEVRPVGMTAGSFSSLSLDPPLILWSIDRSSRSAPIFQSAQAFCVNILAEDQITLSQHFASKIDDKFDGIDWFKAKNDCPTFPGIVGLLECRREIEYDGGDHIIIVGHVDRFIRFSGRPLLFAQGKYVLPQIHPQLQPSVITSSAQSEVKEMELLSTMILEAARLRVGRFEKHRRFEGLNYLQSRILAALYTHPNQLTDDLAQQIFAAFSDCADSVAELIERGLLTKSVTGTVALTDAGRQKRNAIQERSDAYETQCLSGFSAQQIDATRRFLEEFIIKLKLSDSTI